MRNNTPMHKSAKGHYFLNETLLSHYLKEPECNLHFWILYKQGAHEEQDVIYPYPMLDSHLYRNGLHSANELMKSRHALEARGQKSGYLELTVVLSAKRWSIRRTVLRLKLKNLSDRILCSSMVSMAPLPSTSAFLKRSITSGSVPGGKRESYSYRGLPDPRKKHV